MQAVGTYINAGALKCPFCSGLLQEDDSGTVECQDCLAQWVMSGNCLKLVEDYDDDEARASHRTNRVANGRKMKVTGRSVFLHNRLRDERDARLLKGNK